MTQTHQEYKDLSIAKGFKLPADYVTQKGAYLGMTGSGKSYGVGDSEEEMADQGIPFVTIDSMKVHFGLRTKYPIVIFGGDHADIEITPDDGERIAELIVAYNISCVIDVGNWRKDDMRVFAAHFLRELFQRNTTPRHIFLEEADIYAPQRNDGESKLSFVSVDDVMRRGRSKGLGLTLITQRPQVISKDVLSQASFMAFFNFVSSQDLEAIRNVLKHTDGEVGDHIDMLPLLQPGEALLYSPSWLKIVKKVKFRKRKTYHGGNTPKLGEVIKLPKLIPVNVLPMIDWLNKTDEAPVRQQSSIELLMSIPKRREYTNLEKVLIPAIGMIALIIAIAI